MIYLLKALKEDCVNKMNKIQEETKKKYKRFVNQYYSYSSEKGYKNIEKNDKLGHEITNSYLLPADIIAYAILVSKLKKKLLSNNQFFNKKTQIKQYMKLDDKHTIEAE